MDLAFRNKTNSEVLDYIYLDCLPEFQVYQLFRNAQKEYYKLKPRLHVFDGFRNESVLVLLRVYYKMYKFFKGEPYSEQDLYGTDNIFEEEDQIYYGDTEFEDYMDRILKRDWL